MTESVFKNIRRIPENLDGTGNQLVVTMSCEGLKSSWGDPKDEIAYTLSDLDFLTKYNGSGIPNQDIYLAAKDLKSAYQDIIDGHKQFADFELFPNWEAVLEIAAFNNEPLVMEPI